jgi:hypothetical protein
MATGVDGLFDAIWRVCSSANSTAMSLGNLLVRGSLAQRGVAPLHVSPLSSLGLQLKWYGAGSLAVLCAMRTQQLDSVAQGLLLLLAHCCIASA